MDKTSEVHVFCDEQEDPKVAHATFMQREWEGVLPTVANEDHNVMPYEKIAIKMHTPKCEDKAIEQEGLKEATSGYMRQGSMDVVKSESPTSQEVHKIGNQKINTRLELERHVQSSGKMELVVMPQMPMSKNECGLSLEETNLHRQSQSSLLDSSLRSRATTPSPCPGSTLRRIQKQNADDDYSFEHSPVIPFQGKVGSRGLLASPFWERKVSSSGTQGFGSATPGRRPPKPITRREASPDNSPTIPKFGDWDESDPSAAEGFTQVFDQVRDQRQNGSGTRTGSMNGPSHNRGKFGRKSFEGCCCFKWGKS